MNPVGLLIVGLALLPALLAARVWLLVTQSGDDLSGYRHFDGSDG
jgi:hypothetical protein